MVNLYKRILPVFAENRKIERYNVFHATLLIRHANNGKKYLYDILGIKKETSNPLESGDFTWKKPISL